MKKLLLVFLVFSIISILSAEDLTGCWVIRQNQGQVIVSVSGDHYKFIKESYYRGELSTDSGILNCREERGYIIYKNGLKTRVKKFDENNLCENSIEDWVRVSNNTEPGSFNISGIWLMDGGKVTFRQTADRLTGRKFTRGKQISEYSGVINGHMISLKEHHLISKRPDSYHQMAIMDKNKILMYFGWTGDTFITRQ